MRYGSVCSGIEAATVAWHGLGWTPTWFSEIEPFPCAVLKHHYPTVPNHGDMSKFEVWRDESIDLLVGGTPCQSFSVAGLRKGLDDPRGNLMLTFGAIAQRFRPEWLVWENVPGVLSSNGGRDFGTFLGMLAELGYGFAYRVLDAQYFGVAQRRRRVFVVANARSWQRAAAVLFERHSLQGYPAPSREARQGAARSVASGTYLRNAEGGAAGVPYLTCSNINAHINNQTPLVGESVAQPVGFSRNDDGRDATLDLAPTMRVAGRAGGMLGVAQPVAFYDYLGSQGGGVEVGVSPTLKKKDGVAVTQPAAFHPTQDQWIGQPVAMRESGQGYWMQDTVAGTIDANIGMSGHANRPAVIKQDAMQVRRLTPVECERLQGFPDGYTNIPWRKKPESPDGPRYKALGNSMAVPVMRWIGERIQAATARQEVKP